MVSTNSLDFYIIFLNLECPFQDCKEFQGELFGVCNLFRDLSDKLFTSEIIELHEEQGQADGHNPTTKMAISELGTYFIQTKEDTSETVFSATEGRKPKDFKSVATLKDLGMFNFFFFMVAFSSPFSLLQDML